MQYSEFLDILACPECKGELDCKPEELTCTRCNHVFPCRDGVPIMLIEEAVSADERVLVHSMDRSKQTSKKFYSAVSQYLETSGADVGYLSSYLNYGYTSNENKEYSVIQLPKNFLNKSSVKLTLEVVGETALDGKRIIEIGSGRGGNIVTMSKYFKPYLLMGIDITEASVRFCKTNHKINNAFFCVGDAENVPVKRNVFDIVFNLESSHLYPNIHKFYHEVQRILKPGGYFLYSDVLEVELFSAYEQYLMDIGLTVLRNRDITSNVLLSCRENAEKRKGSFLGRGVESSTVAKFLAEPGSPLYKSMKSGRSGYRIFLLRKEVF